MKHRLVRILTPTWQIAWKITLVTLPVTSFPLLSKAAGGTLVAPLAIIPLAWLCLTLIPFDIFARKAIPAETRPLYFFVLTAFLASAFAYFIDIPAYKGFSIFENNLEGMITLGIGLAFFFTTLLFSRSLEDLDTTVKYISMGGILLLLWSLVQIAAVALMQKNIPDWMQTIQSYISVNELQGNTYRFRASGTTLEPSWLAHCLNILYLPLWLAASSRHYSSFRFRILGLSLENLLLAGGIVVLIFTYSRIGLLAFGLVLVWLMLLGSRSLARRLAARFHSGSTRATKILQIVLSATLICLLVLVLGGLAYQLSRQDPRFASLFEMESTDVIESRDIFSFANQLDIAERVIYWDIGWKVFENHPMLGVGLGNAGMFTMKTISYYAWKLPEVQQVVFDFPIVPNTKCLWTRLLAETGLIGFVLFITWLIVLWSSARRLHEHPVPALRTLGLAGQFALMALLLEGFSIDTFALPYWWVALGLLSAAALLGRRLASPSGGKTTSR